MSILLVEDEDFIREIMVDCLQEAGYDVIEANSSTMALDVLEGSANRPSILVTDFHMPNGVDGFELAAQLRVKWSDLPVVITSGRPEVFRSSWRTDLGYKLIRKPFRPSELIKVLQILLPPRRLASIALHQVGSGLTAAVGT